MGFPQPGMNTLGENRTNAIYSCQAFLVSFRQTVIHTLSPDARRLSWVLDPDYDHDLEWVAGSWQLTPLGDGRRTLVEYDLDLDVGRLVPLFVQTRLLQRSLPDVVRSARREVERRGGVSCDLRDGR